MYSDWDNRLAQNHANRAIHTQRPAEAFGFM